MDERELLHTLIVDSLKLSVRECLHWLLLNCANEQLYGLLIDVPSDGDAANILVATEEALERAAVDGDQDALRWSAPGEGGEPWIWPEHRWANGTTHLIQLGIDRGMVPRYDATVKDLAIRALTELEREGVFGTGSEREKLYVGVMDIHDDFENWVEWSAPCNPPTVTARVLEEVSRGEDE